MGLSLPTSLVNNAVNKVFSINGRDARSDDRSQGLKTTDGVKHTFGDSFVTGTQLKNTINDPYSRVALSFRDNTHPEAAQAVAQLVAEGLDGGDGRSDGMIKVNDSSNWFGGKSQVSRYELADKLASGEVVMGEGGKLMSREEAQSHGDTIVAIHENKAGPTLALDR